MVLAALGLPAAADARPGIDTDGDGRYSLVELRSHYPSLSASVFRMIDADGDGLVSPGEFRNGQDRDLLPRPADDRSS